LCAVDILGDFGLSILTRPIHRREDAADWLAAELDGLHSDDAAFIGSTFGGFHSTKLAVHHQDRVRALVIRAPATTSSRSDSSPA